MRKVIQAGIALLALALAMAGVAQAQSPPPNEAAQSGTTVGEVVVRGRKAPNIEKHLPSIVWKDVGVRAQPSHTGKLSRWIDQVCPGTFGLTPAYESFVSRRISDIARQIVPAPPVPCRGINVLVAFTTVPQQFIDDVRNNHPGLLGYHYRVEEKALATFKGPVEVWFVTATNGVIDNTDRPAMIGLASGRMRNRLASSIRFALVVVDANQVQGHAIGPIADHIAALVLSRSAPRTGCGPLPTILDVLDPACPSSASLETLTAYDESFLKALYATNPEDVGQSQRGSIMLHMLNDPHR